MVSVAEAAASAAQYWAEIEQRKKKPAKDAKKAFRSSLAWRRTRYAALAENAERNGGVAKCELCGATAAPGSPLHVDHVEPIARAWERRFDRANLQVLCANCNVGKLAGPARDFRPAEGVCRDSGIPSDAGNQTIVQGLDNGIAATKLDAEKAADDGLTNATHAPLLPGRLADQSDVRAVIDAGRDAMRNRIIVSKV